MGDLWRQGSFVDDKNDPAPENIPVLENIPLPQLEEENSWILEGTICTRRSNSLYDTYDALKKYSCEELMKMKRLEIFLLLFPVDYLKEILIPERNKLLKHPIGLG